MDDPIAWVQARAAAEVDADPVRQRVLEGLARRAALQSGALRERLVAKLLQHAEAAPVAAPARPATNAPSPLTALLAQLQAAGPELRNVAAHQRTWSRLRLNRRMAEVSAPVPEHLGPLNSQVLVTRALQQLRALSPDYLQRLLTQIDALASLRAVAPIDAAEAPARSGGARSSKAGARR